MHIHLISSLLAASTTSTTTSGSSSKGGSPYVLFIFIGGIALVYLLFIRPRSQRMRQQQQAQRQIGVGDEVMSAGGIFGKVVAIDADEVEVEVSPGVVLTFIRRSVSLRQAPQAAPPARGGGFFGARPSPRAAAAAPPEEEPKDPWEAEPDGPGDTAGEPDGHSGPHQGDGHSNGEPGPSGPGTSGA